MLRVIQYIIAGVCYKLLMLCGCQLIPGRAIVDSEDNLVHTTDGGTYFFENEDDAQTFRNKARLNTGVRGIEHKACILIK